MLAKVECDAKECQLPNCRCQGPTTPGDTERLKTPQMVLISFNGDVKESHFGLFSGFFDGRLNPNRCPVKSSFFVHDDSGRDDFRFAQQLYIKGN